MAMFYVIALLTFVWGPAVTAAAEDDSCQVPGNMTLDECLEKFVKRWDDLRKAKPQVDAIVFPVLAMTSDDLRPLCSRIEEAKAECGNATVTCESHEISQFIRQNFFYGCREKDSLFFDQSECLLSTITGQQQCLMLLKKDAGKQQQSNPCSQAEQFFKCIQDEVYRSCKAKGLAALVHAIDRFGCDIKKLDAKDGNVKNEPTCSPVEWQEVATCFQPLLDMWSNIRDNDSSLLETAFPVFKFRRSDLTRMCDIVRVIRDRCFVQIQRCPGHELPEFVNSILGLACGTQQSTFFLSYECIKSTIEENEQCRPYTVGAWQPGHLKEICGRMPQFYKCLEKPVTEKCLHEGAGVLAQSIRQYGCELNTEANVATPQAAAQDATTTTTTTTSSTTFSNTVASSAQTTPDAILDFAVSPPSHTPQPPGPAALGAGIFSAPANVQPFLQESQLQPSFFINAPPAPSLVQGPSDGLLSRGGIGEQQQIPQPSSFIQPAPPASVLVDAQQSPEPSTPAPASFAAPFHRLETLSPIQSGQLFASLPLAGVTIPPSATEPSPAPPAAISTTVSQSSPTIPSTTTASSAVSSIIQEPSPAPPAAISTTATVSQSSPTIPSTATASSTVSSTQSSPTTTQSSPTTTQSSPTTTQSSPTTTQSSVSKSSTLSIVSSTGSTAGPLSTPPKGTVVPIPTVPRLLELCNIEKRNQLRDCLNPLYRRWVEIHGKMMTENHAINLTFPIFHYSKNEVVELCDHYANAFLRCSFSLFQECLTDDVVYLANAIFGYLCSPQNVADFSHFFDCISNVVRQRSQCLRGVDGPLLTVSHDSSTRCAGAKEFYQCNKWQIALSCAGGAEKVFADTVRQYGCDV